MDFLKTLFGDGESLTYDQLSAKVKEAKLNVVNIADGSYVSKAKFDDKVGTLQQQVTDLQGQITQRDTDITDLQTKLTAAQTDAGKLSDAQQQLVNMQTKYNTDKADWEKKAAKQAYEFMVREKANGMKFTSPAAKRDFVRQANGKDFKIDGDTLLGYDDFVTKYKAENPGAIAEDTTDGGNPNPDAGGNPDNKPNPAIVLPSGGAKGAPDQSAFGFHFQGVRPKPTE